MAAGVSVVIATPGGKVPRPDPWGLEPFFHYPQVNENFMFSCYEGSPITQTAPG